MCSLAPHLRGSDLPPNEPGFVCCVRRGRLTSASAPFVTPPSGPGEAGHFPLSRRPAYAALPILKNRLR